MCFPHVLLYMAFESYAFSSSLVYFGVSEALSQSEALSPSAGLPGDGQDALLISSHSGLSPAKQTTAACLPVLSR